MRRLKIAAGTVASMLVLLGVFVGVVYASTEVPSIESLQSDQTTVIYYSDGTTEMARLAVDGGNRTNVTLDQVSVPAQNAVLAAENRSFYTDPGISMSGIVRATWNNLTSGSTQGGSTITQQYVKNAILRNDEQTFSRKFQELFLSIKLDNNYTKQQILENYLNTIYYGRGAYGIESAANTYFGVPAAQLTAQQGAVLAVLVRSPSRYDPEVSPEDALDRWERVLDAMVEEGWMTAEERAASVYPPVLPRVDSSFGIPSGPEGLIVSRVFAEMEAEHGYDEQQLRTGGLRITTTVDKRSQDAAVGAVDGVMATQDEEQLAVLRQALVAVDPKSGAVRAYYGGRSGTEFDYARAQRQPGSSIKPYVLATALEQGISVTSRRDGSSPQEFPDREAPVRNSGGASCPACTLTEAVTRSLNTTFYGLAYEVGPERVAETVRKATGLPDVWEGGADALVGKATLANPATGAPGSAIGIGEYEMRPIDQAVGFATLANSGVRHAPFFVANVTDNAGTVLLENTGDQGEQVMEPDVADDVTYAIQDVADFSRRSLDGGRPVASKTGTVGSSDDDNSDAWMVGYTPSLSTAVWMGSDSREPIVDARGRIIYGSGLPGAIWQEFMNTVLAGTPEEPLPDSPSIRGDTGEGVPEPEPEPAPTSEAPAPTPTTSTPAPTPTPSTSTPAPEPDRDSDGVPDSSDPAPGDPNVPNGRNGGGGGDTDGDGVPDARDPAPNDPNVPGAQRGAPGPAVPGGDED